MVIATKDRDLTFSHYILSLPKQLCKSQEQVLWAVFATSRLLGITSHTVEVTGLCHDCRTSVDRRDYQGCNSDE
jgi:hypothetical protein